MQGITVFVQTAIKGLSSCGGFNFVSLPHQNVMFSYDPWADTLITTYMTISVMGKKIILTPSGLRMVKSPFVTMANVLTLILSNYSSIKASRWQ